MEIVKIGSVKAILIADADNSAVNGSSPTDTDISLTNFSLLLYKDGVEVADESDIKLTPYFFTLDNIDNGRYLANLTLPTTGSYSLHAQHTTDFAVWRIAEWDVELIDHIAAASSVGNRQVEFTLAAAPIAGRNVQAGYLDYMTVKVKRTDDSDWSAPIETYVLYYWYDTLGDRQPIKVGASS